MRKIWIFFVFALLSLCLLGCESNQLDDGGGTTEIPATTEPPVEVVEMIPVIVAGKTDYTIVIDEKLHEDLVTQFDYMIAVMDKKFGTHPEIKDSAEGKKIEFVKTNEVGNKFNYQITIDPETGNVRIAARNATAFSRAIHVFVTQHLAYAKDDLTLDPRMSVSYDYKNDSIDNSSLLSYQGGDKTTLAPSDEEGLLQTPTWLDTAVIVEVRIDMASIGGTFDQSKRLIDFYAKTGVNVMWLTPVYEKGPGGNGYGNVGLHRIDPSLTGTTDQEEGWLELKEFVDYAHSKGIYILLDIITWGTMRGSELSQEHPSWFSGETWGNLAFNWKNNTFKEWFIANAVENIEKTGADGYRCDCEPNFAGYAVFAEIRKRLNDKGIYPVIMAEDGAERRNSFDLEQDGVLAYFSMSRAQLYQKPVNFFVDGYIDLVNAVKKGVGIGSEKLQNDIKNRGTYRYYTNCITNHDYQSRNVNGNRLKIGYAAIYAPFIPLWYMGDAFGVTYEKAVLYDIPVDYSIIGKDMECTYFYEDVKQMISIRRSYPDIFEEYPLNHRNSNIRLVQVDGLDGLDQYVRYANGKGIIVLGNNEEHNDGMCSVEIPFKTIFGKEDPDATYVVTDLLSGFEVVRGNAEQVSGFSAIVPYTYCGVYLVEKAD